MSKKHTLLKTLFSLVFVVTLITMSYSQTYKIVDTNQSTFFDTTTIMATPSVGDAFYGQDAQYSGHQPSYTNNGDGTVTDNVTGLMWQQTLDHNGDGSIDYADKLGYDDILNLAANVTTGGYTDWRVPTIKEQYSLIMFSGRDISGYDGTDTDGLTPFINTDVFGFNYGDTNANERLIDVQCASTTISVGNEMQMVFGVNFADGRIKGYGTTMMGQAKAFNYLMVRGAADYGINDFTDNGDGTVTDAATDLMWMQDDNGQGVIWETALSYAENFENAGHADWRLPNAKELQSIVDYTRSPQSSSSAAIDPIFNCTEITNEAGEADYAYYWSGTTHANMTDGSEGGWGAYVCFGRAMGNESEPDGPPPGGVLTGSDQSGADLPGNTTTTWTDVHGAGAQRSDPKSGDPADYPTGNGPQGDAIRIYNYVRLVRDADASTGIGDKTSALPQEFELGQNYPNPFNPSTTISFSLPTANQVSLKIFDIRGREIATLIDGALEAGTHSFKWQADNMASGICFYKLTSGTSSEMKHMTLLK